MLILFVLQALLLQAANSCIASVSSFLTAPYTAWYPIVILVAFAIIAIIAVIYALSPLIGRSDIATWARVKIYDTLFSIVLISIFAAFATSICTINPVPAFSSVGLTSSQCGPGQVNNIYSLAVCNMYRFNLLTVDMNQALYEQFLVLSTQPALGVTFTLGAASSAITGNIRIAASEIELVPAMVSFKYLGGVVDAVYGLVLLNDVQLILLSGSLIFFSILMAIGLIGRMFSITRTFGGAMIAFALGVGFIYPLMVSVNYGFINYGIEHSLLYYNILGTELGGSGQVYPALEVVKWPVIAQLAYNYWSTGQVPSLPLYGFAYIGFLSLGLLLIPLVILIIVDVFIIDFSQSIGERMDLLSLLIRVV